MEECEIKEQELAGFGAWVQQTFAQTAIDRQQQENYWIKRHLQLNGTNQTEAHSEFNHKKQKDQGGSSIYIRDTKIKTKAQTAKMMSLLFQPSQENMAIEPTEVAEMAGDVEKQVLLKIISKKAEDALKDVSMLDDVDPAVVESIEQLQKMVESEQIDETLFSKDEIEEEVQKEAKTRADKMLRVMADQNTESDYRGEARKCLRDGNAYGTGWIKGPMLDVGITSKWEATEGQWQVKTEEVATPFVEYAPIWDVYPYPATAQNCKQVTGFFQRHVMMRHELLMLAERPGFDRLAILQYIKANPQGNYNYQTYRYESIISSHTPAREAGEPVLTGKYEIIEYNGYNPDSNTLKKQMVYTIGGTVIYHQEHPYCPGINIYHRYVYEDDPNSIYGRALGEDNEEPEAMLNAGIRALINNMGKAAGPIYEVNLDLLDATEVSSIRSLHANRVVLRHGKGAEAQYQAIRQVETSARIGEFMRFIDLARNLSEKATGAPDFATQGINPKSGAASTATGLSMLMGQSNALLSDPVKNFDDGITASYMKALYHWNMINHKNEDIKGDYKIKATGSLILMAKELLLNKLREFANPGNPYVDLQESTKEQAKMMGLPEAMVKTKEQVRNEQSTGS